MASGSVLFSASVLCSRVSASVLCSLGSGNAAASGRFDTSVADFEFYSERL